MTKKKDNSIYLFGISLFSRERNELLKLLDDHLSNSRKTAYIVTPNPEQIVQASTDSGLRSALQQADYAIPDGIGLVWASKLFQLFGKLPESLAERISGVDVAADLLQLLAEKQQTALLLGGRGYQPAQLGQYPQLTWVPGYKHALQPTAAEEQIVRQKISELQPAVVFVAFGAPAQEKWLVQHRELLEDNQVKIALVVGGAFDYLLGRVTRAPHWLRLLGGEWLFRLVHQPWRWKRQLRLVVFLKMVFQTILGKKNRLG